MKIKYKWECNNCKEIFETRKELRKHRKLHKRVAWNKGLTKETDVRILNLSKKVSKSLIGKPGHPVSEETKNKIRNTNKIKHTMGGYRKGSGRGKSGWYKGYYCDSSWELAFVIYNLEHNILFERNKQQFAYTFNGEQHNYIPDWKIENDFVEIKGYWTEQWQAKLDQFPKEENLRVITKVEIKPYLEYVINKYGRNFINLYE